MVFWAPWKFCQKFGDFATLFEASWIAFSSRPPSLFLPQALMLCSFPPEPSRKSASLLAVSYSRSTFPNQFNSHDGPCLITIFRMIRSFREQATLVSQKGAHWAGPSLWSHWILVYCFSCSTNPKHLNMLLKKISPWFEFPRFHTQINGSRLWANDAIIHGERNQIHNGWNTPLRFDWFLIAMVNFPRFCYWHDMSLLFFIFKPTNTAFQLY